VRSKVTRRINVRRSAGGEGERPFDSRRLRMNASMGLRTHPVFRTRDGAGRTGFLNAQCAALTSGRAGKTETATTPRDTASSPMAARRDFIVLDRMLGIVESNLRVHTITTRQDRQAWNVCLLQSRPRSRRI